MEAILGDSIEANMERIISLHFNRIFDNFNQWEQMEIISILDNENEIISNKGCLLELKHKEHFFQIEIKIPQIYKWLDCNKNLWFVNCNFFFFFLCFILTYFVLFCSKN